MTNTIRVDFACSRIVAIFLFFYIFRSLPPMKIAFNIHTQAKHRISVRYSHIFILSSDWHCLNAFEIAAVCACMCALLHRTSSTLNSQRPSMRAFFTILPIPCARFLHRQRPIFLHFIFNEWPRTRVCVCVCSPLSRLLLSGK